MKNVNFGIVGTGAIFDLSHANALNKIDDANIIGIYDLDYERAKKRAKKFKIDFVASDLNDLLKNDNIDAILVATPNDTHCSIVVSAAQHGKHIFCEKPISVNLQEAYLMIEECKKNNVQLQIGFNQRNWKQVEIVKSLSLIHI